MPRFYIPRARAWEHLEQAADCAMTLVVAPAGAGKTLAVAGWVQAVAARGTEPEPIWVHADETWTPARLAEVLERAAPTSAESWPRRVVVDDSHLLPAASSRLLSDRLNNDPESLRVVLTSRWDLPIAHLVPELLGNFAMIRGDVLRLDNDEARSLLAAHARTTAPEVVRAITRYADGWCAAIVLAGRAVAETPDPIDAARRCAEGSARFGDRIAVEVFASLPSRTRHLLLCLSAESAVTPRTAAHLSHDPAAGELLAELDSTGLLVSRHVADGGDLVDGSEMDETVPGTHYRLHPLLIEVARRRLVNDGVDVVAARATVVRAVMLDAAGGDTARALARLEGVRAFEDEASFIAEHGVSMVMRGEGAELAVFAREHAEETGHLPRIWFPLALERWVAGDASLAELWLDRCLAGEGLMSDEELACARLMRARLGREHLEPAVEFAQEVLGRNGGDGRSAILPQLLTELAITQNWLGDLQEAEINLLAAASLGEMRSLPALRIAALSHLAMTLYMLGREKASADVAQHASAQLEESSAWAPIFTPARLRLTIGLARTVDVPFVPVQPLSDIPMHPADLCGRFWLQVHNSHAALVTGSVAEARRILEHPVDIPDSWSLPDHLRLVLLAEEANLAALGGDRSGLRDLENALTGSPFRGATAWVSALRADLEGDRRAAAALFATAAADETFAQPVIRPIALVARAQLLDELGEAEEAYDQLWQAIVETEVRRNAAPFLSWTRQGTPIQKMLGLLAQRSPRLWLHEVTQAMETTTTLATYFDPSVANPDELVALESAHVPDLSPREREVLRQLARGSTYADIGATLFVSENTVKTHVSNVYGKLGASCRSEALAVARGHHLV